MHRIYLSKQSLTLTLTHITQSVSYITPLWSTTSLYLSITASMHTPKFMCLHPWYKTLLLYRWRSLQLPLHIIHPILLLLGLLLLYNWWNGHPGRFKWSQVWCIQGHFFDDTATDYLGRIRGLCEGRVGLVAEGWDLVLSGGFLLWDELLWLSIDVLDVVTALDDPINFILCRLEQRSHPRKILLWLSIT